MTPGEPSDPIRGVMLRGSVLGPSAGDCPDAGTLAGFVEERLLFDEREAVEEHAATCDECVAVIAALVRAGVRGQAARASAKGLGRHEPRTWLAAAAILVIVASLAITFRRAPSTADLLVADARALRDAGGALAGFTPLSVAELSAPGRSALRGGPVLLAPSGRVLEEAPVFRWEASAEVGDCDLVLESSGERRVLREHAVPPVAGALERALPPGSRHTWLLACDTAAGPELFEREFEIATAPERAAFEAARATIEAQADPRVRHLFVAQLAHRRGYLGEAERAARAQVAINPSDDLGRKTLALVLRELGASEWAEP